MRNTEVNNELNEIKKIEDTHFRKHFKYKQIKVYLIFRSLKR